jgi:hypothetical protein
MRSPKEVCFEQQVDELVRGALADMDDEIDPDDMLDYVSGHMSIKGREDEARRIIERRIG